MAIIANIVRVDPLGVQRAAVGEWVQFQCDLRRNIDHSTRLQQPVCHRLSRLKKLVYFQGQSVGGEARLSIQFRGPVSRTKNWIALIVENRLARAINELLRVPWMIDRNLIRPNFVDFRARKIAKVIGENLTVSRSIDCSQVSVRLRTNVDKIKMAECTGFAMHR